MSLEKSEQALPKPEELAHNLQDTIHTLADSPNDATARKALQDECRILSQTSGKISGGRLESSPYHQAVMDELKKMEGNGTLPEIKIIGGLINASCPGDKDSDKPATVVVANSDEVIVYENNAKK